MQAGVAKHELQQLSGGDVVLNMPPSWHDLSCVRFAKFGIAPRSRLPRTDNSVRPVSKLTEKVAVFFNGFFFAEKASIQTPTRLTSVGRTF